MCSIYSETFLTERPSLLGFQDQSEATWQDPSADSRMDVRIFKSFLLEQRAGGSERKLLKQNKDQTFALS